MRPEAQPAQGEYPAPHQALEPRRPPRPDARALAPDLDPRARDALLLAAGEQHADGAVRIEDALAREDAHRHRGPVALGDLAQARRRVETFGRRLVDHELGESAARGEVEHRAEPIRAIALLERTAEPEAAVLAADLRAARVDRAAALGPLVDAARPPELRELVYAQQRAAKAARPADTLGRGGLAGVGRGVNALC